MKVLKQKSLGFADVIVYDNEIFNIHILTKSPLSLDQAIKVNELRLSLMENNKALVLSTSESDFVVPTNEAIEYILSANRLNHVKANAFVIASFSQRLAVKAADRLKKIPSPIRFFSNKKDAIEWLLSQKE